ncbi:MAG: hypothetical protein QOF37_187 [Thermoleophilaceae bacterium]|jgi:hypothetical protein|nr:hypothetical protein [Thermoleophilaceae bacterium]
MSVWTEANQAVRAGRQLPVMTRSRGDLASLYRGVDPRRPVRSSPTLATQQVWPTIRDDGNGASPRAKVG